jgi:aerobic-type carbon monoxide dehydrogenase small subunit (CoxS/CutS family)
MIELNVNGTRHRIETDAETSLLSVLRDELNLTGAKYGCGEGQCGACTVLIDGVAVRSCLRSAVSTAGKRVTTIEGLARNGKLHPVQEAFLEAEALQCGYCTPGMIMSAASLLSKKANPTTDEIAHSMEGNMCRCGTYNRVLVAIQDASRRMAQQRKGGTK